MTEIFEKKINENPIFASGLRHVFSWPKLGLEPKIMTLGLLVALENVNKVLSDIQRIFNTVPYGDPPLKIKISKSGFLHAREDQKIGPEPKFHVPRSSNGKD